MWVFNYFYFSCSVSVYHWCICTGIASAFFFTYFSASMRACIPCFPGATIACLIATSFHSLDNRSTQICLNPKALHTSCILIHLHQPSENIFPPIHKVKALLKNIHVGLILQLMALAHPANILGVQTLLMLRV